MSSHHKSGSHPKTGFIHIDFQAEQQKQNVRLSYNNRENKLLSDWFYTDSTDLNVIQGDLLLLQLLYTSFRVLSGNINCHCLREEHVFAFAQTRALQIK